MTKKQHAYINKKRLCNILIAGVQLSKENLGHPCFSTNQFVVEMVGISRLPATKE